jgi:hypothetical protein
MTKHEFYELKKLAKLLWSQADVLEMESDDRLRATDLSEWGRMRTKAEAYKHTSTLLSMKLEKLQRNGNKQ